MNGNMESLFNRSDIQVWTALIDETVPVNTSYLQVLAPDEQERAQRFRCEHHRNRYITFHYATRKILSHYIQIPPQDIIIEKGTYGKPVIKLQSPLRSIAFNASSTSNMIAISCTHDRNIGIDIEFINPKLDIETIIPSLFSTEEMKHFDTIDGSNRLDHVLQIWTAKEAYVKAMGTGLSYPLKDITLIQSDQNTVTVSRAMDDDPGMHILHFYPGDGYTGSLAYDGPPASIEYMTWKPH